MASPKLTPGWCPAAFPQPTAALPGPGLAEAAVQGAVPLPPPPAPPGCCAVRGRWHRDRHQTFPSLLFLLNFFRIAGAAQLAKAELRPLTAGFHPVRAPGCCRARVASGAQSAASHAMCAVGSCTGDQHLRGILALTLVAFFKIHWNLTAKPTSISVPERFSSLRASIAAVTLF